MRTLRLKDIISRIVLKIYHAKSQIAHFTGPYGSKSWTRACSVIVAGKLSSVRVSGKAKVMSLIHTNEWIRWNNKTISSLFIFQGRYDLPNRVSREGRKRGEQVVGKKDIYMCM